MWITWVITDIWWKFHPHSPIGNIFTEKNTYFPHCISWCLSGSGRPWLLLCRTQAGLGQKLRPVPHSSAHMQQENNVFAVRCLQMHWFKSTTSYHCISCFFQNNLTNFIIYPKTRFYFGRLGYTLLELIIVIIILTNGIAYYSVLSL